jgi:hypothetical protein
MTLIASVTAAFFVAPTALAAPLRRRTTPGVVMKQARSGAPGIMKAGSPDF